jgi:hypothetical protein
MTPQGVVAVLGRPDVSAPGVDESDPVAVLSAQVGQLVTQPPPGITFTVMRPVHALNVDGKPAAEAVLKVTKAGSTFYFERAYVAAPSGSTQLFEVDASAPVQPWEAGDGVRVESLINSLKFTS